MVTKPSVGTQVKFYLCSCTLYIVQYNGTCPRPVPRPCCCYSTCTVIRKKPKMHNESTVARSVLLYGSAVSSTLGVCLETTLLDLCILQLHFIPFVASPSCLQTTSASMLSHRSSQTVPHTPPTHTSTRPSLSVVPFCSLTWPAVEQLLLMPAQEHCH